MSKEITLNTSLTITKGTLSDSTRDRYQTDLTGSKYAAGVVSVGTSTHQALATTTITTPGFLYVKNLDATNYIQVGADSSGTFVPYTKLKAGESFVFRPATSALYAKANTAAAQLQFKLFDD